MPLPDVPATMVRYLDAVKAIVSEKEFQKAKKHVDQFLEDKETISAIDKILQERSDKMDNWVQNVHNKDFKNFI